MATYRCAACGGINRLTKAAPQGKKPICGKCRVPLDTAAHPQPVDSAGLARAIAKSPAPVLVDFWAAWCGPCRAAAPILEEIAQRQAGEMLVLKLDIDAAPDAAGFHSVRGVPTFIMFSGGVEVDRQVGLLPKPAFHQWAARHVSGR